MVSGGQYPLLLQEVGYLVCFRYIYFVLDKLIITDFQGHYVAVGTRCLVYFASEIFCLMVLWNVSPTLLQQLRITLKLINVVAFALSW